MILKKRLVPVLAALLLLAALASGCAGGVDPGEDPTPSPAVTPDPTPVPTLSGEPQPILETYGIDPEEIGEMTYSFFPFGERTLRRGEGGFDQVLELLASLKGAPVKAQRFVARTLRLDCRSSHPLFIGSDGERVYISLGWEDFQLLDTEGRPDDELEAIFAAYAPAPVHALAAYDAAAYRTDGGLSLTAEKPAYDYAAMQEAIPRSRRRFYELDGGATEEEAIVHLTAENQGDEPIDYSLPTLLALRDGEWVWVPTFSPLATTFERKCLQPGEKLETGLSMELYADPLEPGKYCACMVYSVGDAPKHWNTHIAYAPFEIVG